MASDNAEKAVHDARRRGAESKEPKDGSLRYLGQTQNPMPLAQGVSLVYSKDSCEAHNGKGMSIRRRYMKRHDNKGSYDGGNVEINKQRSTKTRPSLTGGLSSSDW